MGSRSFFISSLSRSFYLIPNKDSYALELSRESEIYEMDYWSGSLLAVYGGYVFYVFFAFYALKESSINAYRNLWPRSEIIKIFLFWLRCSPYPTDNI